VRYFHKINIFLNQKIFEKENPFKLFISKYSLEPVLKNNKKNKYIKSFLNNLLRVKNNFNNVNGLLHVLIAPEVTLAQQPDLDQFARQEHI